LSRFNKLISAALACLMLLCACDSDGPGTQEGSTQQTTDILTGGDSVDTEPIVVDPMADKDKETDKDGADGSFYDSFTENTDKWKVADDQTTLKAVDGSMKFVTTKNDPDGSCLRKNFQIPRKDNFVVEFRLMFPNEGEGRRVGFRLDMGNARIMMQIFPDAVFFAGPNTAYDDIDLPIENDWHVYRLVRDGEHVHFYFDGQYILTFLPQTGSFTNGLMFYGSATTTNPLIYYVDYISFSPLKNEVRLLEPENGTVIENSNRLSLQTAVDSSILKDGGEVVYYANGIRIGSSDKKNIQYSYDWEGIEPGVYYISAKYGDTESWVSKVTFTGDTEKKPTVSPADGKVSEGSTLLGGYHLTYRVEDDKEATVSAKNGTFALQLTHSGGKVTVLTDEGEATLGCGIGVMRAVVDGGVCHLYRNNRIVTSFRMPTDFTTQSATVSGNSATVTALKVEAGTTTWYTVDTKGSYEKELGTFDTSYAVEFVHDAAEDGEVTLYDGLYKLKLTFKNGVLSALDAPRGIPLTAEIGKLETGKKVYRMTVEGGIGMLYANNRWVASIRLPASNADPYLSVDGNLTVEIRSTEEVYYEDIDFTDDRYLDYLHFERGGSGKTENGQLVMDQKDSAYAAVIENFSHNATFTVTANMNGKTSGVFYLLARYTNEYHGIFVGYNFDRGRYELGTNLPSAINTLLATKNMPAPEGTAVFTVTTDNNRVLFSVNGEILFNQAQTTIRGFCNSGIQTDGGVTVEHIAYEGDGYIQRSAYATVQPTHYPDITELSNGTLLMADNGISYVSTDGGNTWKESGAFKKDAMSRNVITLSNGKLLTIRAKTVNGATQDQAYLSEDNGKTWKGPFAVQGKASNRITMNCKVSETTTGRIIYAANETGHAQEHAAEIGIYYSDNGMIWKLSKTELNYRTTGINLQEPVVTDLGNGTLRLFARTGNGFLYYSDSFDNGETWETDLHPSSFPAVCSAFNVERDRETGYLWMAWEYDCENDHGQIQYPRTRVGVAVSFDQGKTWNFVADADVYNEGVSMANHFNIGMNVTSDHIFVTVIKVTPKLGGTENKNLVIRYEKDKLIPLARLSRLHVTADHSAFRPGYTDTVLDHTILASQNNLFVGGRYLDPITYEGADTYLSLDRVASFIGGEYAGGKITFGKTTWAFTDGSDLCKTYAEITMKHPAKKVNGQLAISLVDVSTLFELTLHEGDGYTAVYYAPYAIDFERFDMHIRTE